MSAPEGLKPKGGGYWIHPLRQDHIEALAPHVSEADRLDLLAADYDPETALQQALLEPGEAWAAGSREGHILGAFGWTEAGAVWSMWRPLTRGEQRTILKLTPRLVRALVRDAGGIPLGNVTYVGNTQIIDWLKATNCFTFLDSEFIWRERAYVPFFVKPLGDLISV